MMEVARKMKEEAAACSVCGAAGEVSALTGAAAALLARYADVAVPRACTHCGMLLTDLERAEAEYARHKAAFEAVLARNPLYTTIKLEPDSAPASPARPSPPHRAADSGDTSEDEPLALTKQKRHQNGNKKDKKSSAAGKKTRKSSKLNNKDSRNPWNLASEIVEQLTSAPVKVEAPLGSDPAMHTVEVKLEFEEGESYPAMEPDFEEDPDFEVDPGSGSADARKTSSKTGSKARSGKRGRTKRRGRPPGVVSKEPKEFHNCDLCSNKYKSLKRLEQHLQKHEKGPFICEVCGARYKHKRACDIHVALHRGISDWKCLECDKLFPSRGALQRHNNIHTGTPCYQCDQCGKSFIHTSSFKMHKLSHSGLKAHACGVCGLKLMTRSHLKRHARVHSGEKRHECALCGKRFSERYNLVAHARAHTATGAATTPPAAGSTAPRRRLFRCLFCNERFERRYMLERHSTLSHGRTLERAPPTPRNTMSKLLKAQAQGARVASAAADTVKPEHKSPSAPSPAPPAVGSAPWTEPYLEVPLRPFLPSD